MEKINTEILISSLISIGFDKVDSLLYTYTLAKLTTDNYRLKTFCFEEKEFSQTFNKYIEYWIYVKFLDTIFCRNLPYLNLFQFPFDSSYYDIYSTEFPLEISGTIYDISTANKVYINAMLTLNIGYEQNH